MRWCQAIRRSAPSSSTRGPKRSDAAKIARYYTGRPAIIAFENSFHGRTMFAMSLTGKTDPYKKGFGPFVPEVYRVPRPTRTAVPLAGIARRLPGRLLRHHRAGVREHGAP